VRWKALTQRLTIKKTNKKNRGEKYFEKSKSVVFLKIVIDKFYQRISKFTKGFLDF